jgi:hypothetical protein
MKSKKLAYGVLIACILVIVGFGLFMLNKQSTMPPITATPPITPSPSIQSIPSITPAPSIQSTPLITPGESNFNLIFAYGVGAKNRLDTFKGIYTRDMVDDPSITVNLYLSKNELDIIYQKMVEINFFDYPDKFSVSIPPEEDGIFTPYSSYYFKVKNDSKIKELWWDDNKFWQEGGILTYKDEKAEKLKELIELIKNIIESKEEYTKLPTPREVYI